MIEIFTEEFLKEIEFKNIPLPKSKYSKKGQYGKAQSIKGAGITTLNWNNEGASCTYFGEPLEANVFLGIEKDWGTRRAFNGYVFNQDDVRRLLKMTW